MKKRILLVNEDPAVRRMLSRVLTGEGHQVLFANPQRDSLRAALRRGLDVVVLDSDLPNENVFQLLEPASPADHLPPTILLSDRAAERGRWSGRNILAVMEKPLDLPRLLRIIESLPPLAPTVPAAQNNGLASAA